MKDTLKGFVSKKFGVVGVCLTIIAKLPYEHPAAGLGAIACAIIAAWYFKHQSRLDELKAKSSA